MPDVPQSSPSAACSTTPNRYPAVIPRVDPRTRIIAAAAFSAVVAVADRLGVLGAALAVSIVTVGLAGLHARAVLRRLVPLNLIMLALAVLLPLGTEGAPLFTWGPIHYSQEGLLLAARIAMKGNAIVLALAALLGTMEMTTLGHALAHLRVPDKLAHLLLFTVRYLDVLHREYLRLAAAMKVRAFHARMDRHTWRTYGYLVGMLLVRSLDRSERIVAAMKCRGFRGRFYLLDHFAFSGRDAWFAAAASAVLLGLAVGEWL